MPPYMSDQLYSPENEDALRLKKSKTQKEPKQRPASNYYYDDQDWQEDEEVTIQDGLFDEINMSHSLSVVDNGDS